MRIAVIAEIFDSGIRMRIEVDHADGLFFAIARRTGSVVR